MVTLVLTLKLGAQYTWMAFVGPQYSSRGEWNNAPTLHLNQVFATICQSFGVDYKIFNPEAGLPITVK
jgi:hypothetical protein